MVPNGTIRAQSLESLRQRLLRVDDEFETWVLENRGQVGPETLLTTIVLAACPWTMKLFTDLHRH